MKADRIRNYVEMYYEHQLPDILAREFKNETTRLVNEIKIEINEVIKDRKLSDASKSELMTAIDKVVAKWQS